MQNMSLELQFASRLRLWGHVLSLPDLALKDLPATKVSKPASESLKAKLAKLRSNPKLEHLSDAEIWECWPQDLFTSGIGIGIGMGVRGVGHANPEVCPDGQEQDGR